MLTLVTGATGLLGSELVRQLLARGEAVRILRRPDSPLDLLGEASGRVEHATGDVTDPEAVRAAMQGVSHVYHAAAFVGFGGRRDRERLYEVNVGGTATVANAALAAGVTRLVHTSSMAAFGRTEASDAAIDEETEWSASRLNTRYARSKHDAELEVQRAAAEGLDAVIVNPALLFGPGRPGENTMQIVEQACRGRLRAAPAGGTNVADVADVAAGQLLAMERGRTGERYFLGGENLSWREILTLLAEACGAPPPRFVFPPTLALAAAYAAEGVALVTRTRPLLTRETALTSGRFFRYSTRKAAEELGYRFRPFRETAARIVREAGLGHRESEGLPSRP